MFENLEHLIERMDPSLAFSLEDILSQSVQSLGQMISGLSSSVVGAAPAAAIVLPVVTLASLFLGGQLTIVEQLSVCFFI